jgi:hypothetical protein
MLEALIPVIAEPSPDTLVKAPVVAETFVELTSVALIPVAVTTLPAKEPLESLATIVEAPLAEAAVVAELGILVKLAPEPLNKVAVTALPEKEPFASRATIVDAPLAAAAVVNAFEMVPLVILEALILVSVDPLPAILAIKAPTTVTFPGKLAF